MTDPAPVPWPGTEPAPFEFPFAEAAVARTALEELHTELTDTEAVHSNAFAGLSALNQGETMRLFRSGHLERISASATAWLWVIAALGTLDDLVARARVAEEQRADAHAAWSARSAAYQQAVADGHPVGSRPSWRNIPI